MVNVERTFTVDKYPFLRGLFEKLADGVIPAMTQAIAELPA